VAGEFKDAADAGIALSDGDLLTRSHERTRNRERRARIPMP
jgi:hypothetical protein